MAAIHSMLQKDSHRRLECRWNVLTATEVNGSMAGKWDVQCRDFKVLMRKVIRVFSLQEVVAKKQRRNGWQHKHLWSNPGRHDADLRVDTCYWGKHTKEASTRRRQAHEGGKHTKEASTRRRQAHMYSWRSIESTSYEQDHTLEWSEVCAYKTIFMRVQMQCRCVQSIIRWGCAL